MDERVGQQFGNYRLLRLLGRGGFAEVYLGQHVRISVQQAAIKILIARLNEEDIQLFAREAETISSLIHRHIVRLLDFDVAQGIPFLVMDFAPNGSLRQRHKRGEQVALSTVISYVQQLAEGLQYAHDRKIIHRDIKPDNMLIGLHNEIVLSDFGIATIAHNTSSMSSQAVSGTIPYMAPEQIQSRPRPASDQYALGITVYEWLTGERPFQGSLSEIVAKQLMAPPPPLREKLPTLLPEVEQVILHALAKEPQQRFASVTAFARALEQASQSASSITVLSEREIPISPALNRPAFPQMSPSVVPTPEATIVTGPANASASTPPEVPGTLPVNTPLYTPPLYPTRPVAANTPAYPYPSSVTPIPAPATPTRRLRARNVVLFVAVALLVIGGAVSYPFLSQYFLAGGTHTGPSPNNSPSSQGNNSGNTTVSNGKNCKKIGVLLPETATSARWDSQDRPELEQQIPQDLPGATVDYSNAQGDAGTQLNQAEADLTRGDCILIVAATDSVAAAQIVTQARAQGVPVIAYDRLIQSQNLAYYVSFNNEAVGQLQGHYIADHYQSYVTAGHNNIVMINGSQTDNNALLFYQGATSILNPLYTTGSLKKVYDTFTPNWDNPTAQTEMASALAAYNNDIQIAYVANDGMANSVIAALKAAGLNGKVLVTGQDTTIAGIQNILTGDQTMTIEKNYALEAQATARLIAAISTGANTSYLTNGAVTSTNSGGSIPSLLKTPIAIDRTNFQQVVTDNLLTKAEICQGLPANAIYLPVGYCS